MRRFLSMLLWPLRGLLWGTHSACWAVLPSVGGLLVFWLVAAAVMTVIGVFYMWFALPLLAPFLLPLLALYLVMRTQSS